MSSYAKWLAQRASSANVMELHQQILPCGHRMVSEYRSLLQDTSRAHLHPVIRSRLSELEQTLAQLRGAQAA